MLTSIFKQNLHKKRKEEVCIKARSTLATGSLKGWNTKPTTVKWPMTTITVLFKAKPFWQLVFHTSLFASVLFRRSCSRENNGKTICLEVTLR